MSSFPITKEGWLFFRSERGFHHSRQTAVTFAEQFKVTKNARGSLYIKKFRAKNSPQKSRSRKLPSVLAVKLTASTDENLATKQSYGSGAVVIADVMDRTPTSSARGLKVFISYRKKKFHPNQSAPDEKALSAGERIPLTDFFTFLMAIVTKNIRT
ncbi:hypothetical protein CDAR_174571 [Caerostris darwini]|uniref:DUF4817 domain-containing protein n=1 Tax=Caerostris darwini TaxID=1538125 RepID=A0AAV4SQ80_9ARAC|nr:hypothetical protein CDAR_174571 [Caerostris darwini]